MYRPAVFRGASAGARPEVPGIELQQQLFPCDPAGISSSRCVRSSGLIHRAGGAPAVGQRVEQVALSAVGRYATLAPLSFSKQAKISPPVSVGCAMMTSAMSEGCTVAARPATGPLSPRYHSPIGLRDSIMRLTGGLPSVDGLWLTGEGNVGYDATSAKARRATTSSRWTRLNPLAAARVQV